MNFGERLRALRLYQNMTQEELAKRIGIKKQTISRYENSDREPNIRTAKKIADALGVPLSDIVPIDEDTEEKIAARNGDEEIDPVILDLITKLEEAPLTVRNTAIAAALAVLKSDLIQK